MDVYCIKEPIVIKPMKKVVYPILMVVLILSTGCHEIGRQARVENEVLNAFESLANSMSKTEMDRRDLNHDRRGAIQRRVEEQMAGGNYKHEWMLEELDVIREQSASLGKYIHSIEKKLKTGAGYIAETGEIVDKRDVEESGLVMMGHDPSANEGSGNGEAYELRKKLEDYEEKCNQRMANYQSSVHPDLVEYIEPLVVQPKDDPYIAEHEPDRALLTWEGDKFYDKPVVAHLATLTQLRLEVVDAEASQLALLGDNLGYVNFKIDSLLLVDSTINNVVAAGMKFETKLFVAKTGAEADSIVSGKTQSYNATIINGGDTIPVKGEFKVRMPEVKEK